MGGANVHALRRDWMRGRRGAGWRILGPGRGAWGGGGSWVLAGVYRWGFGSWQGCWGPHLCMACILSPSSMLLLSACWLWDGGEGDWVLAGVYSWGIWVLAEVYGGGRRILGPGRGV